jgi:Ser/Thr protein kinase RdoA (MazF antagonist)
MNTNAKAHGLDGTLVAPDWPPLQLDEVRKVLSNFPDVSGPFRIMSVSPRPFSAASVVAANGRRVFVKRHHSKVRDAGGLMEEHRFMACLRANGAPVPSVFGTTDGATALEAGGWTYEVHDAPAGIDLYENAISWTPFRSNAHAHSAGGALARLHIAARNYSAPPRIPRPLVASFTIFAATNPADSMQQYLAARPALAADEPTLASCDEALDLLAPFHAELLTCLPALEPLWTQNDLHASNLFWSDASDTAEVTAVIDFGLSDRSNAVYDLAQAIERNIVEWLVLTRDRASQEKVRVHLDQLVALLDGYDSVRHLTDEEAEALAPMTALSHAEFALTETDYFLGVLHSPEKALVASYDYLVGHARWFRSPSGAKMLNAIREWASARRLRAVRT